MAVTNYDKLNLALFEEANEQFNTHLNAVNNNRIIFSGKFGHGKTTFLRWFFDQEAQQKKYNVIRLFPVNYSVASNEDIFEYIKYDILLEMLANGYSVKDLDTSAWSLAPFFIKDNKLKVASFLAKRLPVIGKALKAVENDLATLKKDFDEYCKEAAKYLRETDTLKEFYNEFDNRVGSLYERNAITELIRLMLQRGIADEGNGEKETILIIDDLDRIDPEHVFRILNVFAAHFDLHTGDNKFGFDKVMVVCDIENVRNVFKAKYGVRTDFNGYLDKFYSVGVFPFEIKMYLKRFVEMCLQDVIWTYENGNIIDKRYMQNPLYFLEEYSFFYDMLMLLIENRQVDLRNIIKLKNQHLVYLFHIGISDIDIDDSEKNIFPLIFSLRLLAFIKGDPESLKNAVQNITSNSSVEENLQTHFDQLAYLYLVKWHKNIGNEDHDIKYDLEINGKSLLLQVNANPEKSKIAKYQVYKNQGGSIHRVTLYRDDFIQIFSKTIDFLKASNTFS